jgi:hypothetical protein
MIYKYLLIIPFFIITYIVTVILQLLNGDNELDEFIPKIIFTIVLNSSLCFTIVTLLYIEVLIMNIWLKQ